MNPQLDTDGRLRHLISLDGLSGGQIDALLQRAQALVADARGGVALRQALAGKAVCTLFFEPSTRTRSSFSLAAQRLGADLLNFDASTASTTKGETDIDTLKTLEAMGVHGFVVRHKRDGAVDELAQAAAPGTVLLNAGDGRSNHPTQGLLDMLTLRQAKGEDFSRLKVVIVGDVKHSRVARSDLHALRALGCGEIRVCGPASLLPDDGTLDGCIVGDDLDATLDGVDAAMTLRQHARVRAVGHRVADLHAAVHRAGMHDDGIRRGAVQARGIEAVVAVVVLQRGDQPFGHAFAVQAQHQRRVDAFDHGIEIVADDAAVQRAVVRQQ